MWLSGVAFCDPTHGLVVGDHGTILATDDGGAAWVARDSGTGKWLCAVSFPEQMYGWW